MLNLAGDGLEIKTGLKPTNSSKLERHEVEEQSSIRFSCKRNELALRLRSGRIVDVLQIRCLTAQTRAVINDLAIDLS